MARRQRVRPDLRHAGGAQHGQQDCQPGGGRHLGVDRAAASHTKAGLVGPALQARGGEEGGGGQGQGEEALETWPPH